MRNIKSVSALVSSSLYIILCTYSNNTLPTIRTDDKESQAEIIRKEVPGLTSNEAKLMENHLKKLLKEAYAEGNQDDQQYYEYLLRSFWKGHYDSVIAELKSLGDNPQSILKLTGLRESLLNGTLVSVPWYIREIATIPAMDFSKNFDTSYKNKLLYLEGMLEHLRNASTNHYAKEMQQALAIVQQHFEECKEHLQGVFLTKVNNDLKDVEELLEHYSN